MPMSSAATTVNQNSPVRRPQSQFSVMTPVSHSRKPLMISEMSPSVRM